MFRFRKAALTKTDFWFILLVTALTIKDTNIYVINILPYSSPNPPDSGPTPVTWPAFTEEDQAYLVLDLKPRVELKYRADKVAFWNELVPKMIEFTKTKEMEEKGEDKETAPKDEL